MSVHRLGAEPSEDLSERTTAAERIGMMWPLALEAWELARRDLPSYPRGETPVSRRPRAE